MHLSDTSDVVKGDPVEKLRGGSGSVVLDLASDTGKQVRVSQYDTLAVPR